MSYVTLARYRNTDYVVRCEIDGSNKTYKWKGSQGNKIDRKKVPEEVVDWLNMNSSCFSKGALVIEDKDEKAQELIENFADKEEYKNNIHSYDEIKNLLLKAHYKSLEKQLNKITADDEKRYIIDVAKDFSDDITAGKQDIIAKWFGSEKDILFE